MSLLHLTRYRVYSSDKSKDYKCVVAAMTRREALRIARNHGLSLSRTAHAHEERGAE